MCGIVGYWSRAPIEAEDLATFTDLLAHRGPDGVGYLSADSSRLGLGHRRLAILDPGPRSRQPMLTEDGRYAIVFNGEIFNFLEIREELRSRGHRFRSESDTEVILQAYAEWGPECQDRFNGMWAFAIWDNAIGKLFLSRDRFGIKPLLLLETRDGTAFASEAKAFFALPWSDASAVDADAVSRHGIRGVRALKAGTCATLRGPTEELEIRRWWNPLDHIHPESASYPKQVDHFRELFLDACRLRLRSDVPIGTAISGGLDSSAVLAAVNALGAESVARRPTDWSRAFTVVARGTEHDELEYAVVACKSAGVDANVIDLFQCCDPNHIDEYLYLTEGRPLTNLPAWYLYRSMREQGIRVSLDGQGADEILAGYSWDAMRILRLEGSWLRRPLRTLSLVTTIQALTRDSPYGQVGAKMLAVLSSPTLRWIAGRSPKQRSKLPPLLAEGHDEELWEMAKTLAPLNSILFMAVHGGIPDLLERYDALSMSNGLEIRMPFLDWRLVCYALSLPAESLLGKGFTKRILRDAMTPYLPPQIVERRRKLQFQGPIKQLLQKPLKPWLNSYPGLSRSAPDALATGTYEQISEFGIRVVAEWKERTYAGLANANVAALRARHRSDPASVYQHTQTMCKA